MVYARMMSVSNTTTICLSTKHLSMYLKLFPFGIIIISMFSLLYINFPTDSRSTFPIYNYLYVYIETSPF